MEHPSPFVGDGRRARPTHGKGDATTPVNGYPLRIGSGMTPGVPEMGWPPPSYISEMLIARRAPFHQNEGLSVMMAPFPSAFPLRVIAAVVGSVSSMDGCKFRPFVKSRCLAAAPGSP